ncbi:MAG: cytochrome c3 family protein [Planctomycetota bacterium]|jgi:predicted CXXCH cytochrome family protein
MKTESGADAEIKLLYGEQENVMSSKKLGYRLVVLLVCVLACSSRAVEKPTSPQKTCVTEECHADYGKEAHVHAPVGLGECKSCHKPLEPKDHTWQFVRKGRDLCEYCHLDQTAKQNIHEPLKTGDCIQCHEPHSSKTKFLIREESVADLCQNCHQTGKGLSFLHGPTAVGQCTICHESHSSDHKSLLTMEPSELCFSCHVITKNELQKFEFVHQPAKDNCIGCHDGHGADNAMMLKARAPQLCYPCHEDIKQAAEGAKYKHSVVGKEDGCMHCHTPHASTIQYGLKDAPMALCMSCHDKPVGVSKDEVMAALTDEITDKKFLHGPVAQKDCKGCHVSHGSEHFRLLEKEYPPEFYAPFSLDNYDLCFSCHPQNLVLTKRTPELTDFRNGDLNLHYLHVNKSRRGRTCRSCHATHASDLPKHVRESVPYGMWDLPIQFEKTETGGSCKPGCHLPFAYDRESPVEYKKP